MASCAGCGSDLPNDAVFCPQCGRQMAAQPAVPQPVTLDPTGTLSDVLTIQGGLSKAQPTLPPGAVFHARYRVERYVGAGAMGVVYAANDQVTGRTVALKLISPALADRPTAREKFLREGLMARDIRHSKIVAMYDVGEADGQVYLVMEYLTGDTLRKWLHKALQEGKDLPFDTVRGIIRSILEGLSAAHATGVVHRDLKPENVMLTGDPNQGDFNLKILDFGIARATGTASHLTTTSSSTGTPLYMAPEQKTAADTVGPSADIYAVTAMLYEMLIGAAPDGRSGAPSKERKDLPVAVDAIVETGLATRAKNRFQSAGDFIAALDAVGSPVKPVPPQPPPPQPPPQPPPPTGDKPWWKERMPIVALWRRMSKVQRYVFIGLMVFLGLGMIRAAIDEFGRRAEPMNVQGRWADEVTGTGVAVTYVDLTQQGTTVTGGIFNAYGVPLGTLTGRVTSTAFDYDYLAGNGATGSGHAEMTNYTHLSILVTDGASGRQERHTLHRNHMPPQ
jgi:serine/threonine protein kinase